MKKIKILIADDMKETRAVVRKILGLQDNVFEVVGEAGNGQEVLDLIPDINPDVVLMDINMPVLNGLEATEKITSEYPEIIVIMMSVQAESEYLKSAMFNGAKEYIIKPFNYVSLTETITTTYNKYKNRQAHSVKCRARKGQIITFFSSKGGVGKSTLALNTAMILSKDKNKKILLLDLDLQFGDLSMIVNPHDKKSIFDQTDREKLNAYENIEPYVYTYSDNLDMLFAPQKPEIAESITKEHIQQMVSLLKKEYDVIIVDTGVNYNEHTLCILDYSEQIFFVSTLENVSLKNTKLGMRIMHSLGYDKDKVKLVINRFKMNYRMNPKDIEEVVKDGVFAMIPEEEKTISIINSKNGSWCKTTKNSKQKLGIALEVMCKELTSRQD